MSELKLYNTLTRQKEAFKPIDPQNVRMYVCGPTVYDFAHIGNARPAIVFDVLFRLLRHLYGADHVSYVRNITDVDDKINARALRDFPGLPLNEAIAKVTATTEAQYHKDVAALGCLPPTHEPHATAHIPGMAAMIQQLLDKGHAYIATGREGREVLFDVTAMPDYGQLSRRKLDEQQAGARIAVEAHKKNPADFVLWKESAANEPGWDAHFHFQGAHVDIYGRPGWHIECSVMSEAHLGKVFDIHGGGLDLIFPHHENEIAQSRCAHGTQTMANYWMHNGFLQVEGRKMSKSEGNFVTIHELLETEKFGGRIWLGEALRLAMISTHYRDPIDWTQRTLHDANEKLRDWATTLLGTEAQQEAISRFETGRFPKLTEEFAVVISDDLNTAEAIKELDALHSSARKGNSHAASCLMSNAEALGLIKGHRLHSYFPNSFLSHGARMAPPAALLDLDALRIANANGSSELVARLKTKLMNLGVSSSLDVDGGVSYVASENKWDDLVRARLALLAAKNFAEADRIREELAAQGIQLMDYKDAQTGERKTKWEVKR